MLLTTLLYHLLLLPLDLAVLALLWRWVVETEGEATATVPRSASLALVASQTLAAAAALAIALAGGEDEFGLLRLLAWDLFGHLPLVLAGSAWLLRRRRPLQARLCAAVAALAWAVALDAFVVEPRWIEVTRTEIASASVPRPVRVVVAADLQTDRIGRHERRALRRIVELEPDLILFPGDFVQVVDPDGRRRVEADLRALLSELELAAAPLGAWAVPGDMDGLSFEELFAGTGVHALRRTRTVQPPGAPWLALTGLSLRDSRRADLVLPPAPGFHLVFGHAPEFALAPLAADLLVAGHTHGGQVQLPFVGPLLTFARVPRSWSAGGAVALDGGGTLYVSRGIGMERDAAPRLRFLCRPEIAVIDLVPASDPGPGDAPARAGTP